MRAILERDGDFVLKDGDFVLVENQLDLEQCILEIFNTRKGEFFLDVDNGINKDPLEEKLVSDEEIIGAILDAISQEPRITEVLDIEIIRRIDRSVVINIHVLSDGREILLEEVEIDVWN